jgi:putative ABC transport system permease protein
LAGCPNTRHDLRLTTLRLSGVSLALVVLAAVNAILTAWATALDARSPSALARSLGATPAQVTAGVSAAQLLPALAGAVAGVPAGTGLFKVVNGGGVVAIPAAEVLRTAS